VTQSREHALGCTVTRMGSEFDTGEGDAVSTDAFYQVHLMAYDLFKQGRWEDAVAACDEVIDRYGGDKCLDVMLRVADVMSLKCSSLRSSPCRERLVAAVDALPLQFGESTDPDLRSRIASALQRTAEWLLLIGSVDPAIVVTEGLLARFGREGDPAALAGTGRALVRIASALSWNDGLGASAARERLGRLAILADSLWAAVEARVRQMALWSGLRRHQNSRRPEGCELSRAGHGRASRLFRDARGRLDLRRTRLEQAVRLDDAVIERLRYAADPVLRRIAIEAKINRGASHVFLGNLKQSWADWDELVPMNDPASAQVADKTDASSDQEYVEHLVAANLWKRTGAK
jgi:hypothetical protein